MRHVNPSIFYILFRYNLLLLPGSHGCVGVAVSTLDASADKSILTPGAVIGNYALKGRADGSAKRCTYLL